MNIEKRFFLPPSSSLKHRSIARRQSRDLVVAGIFIILMIISFFSVLFWLSQGAGKRYSIYAYFKEVTDIRPGSHVFQAGYAVGVVGDIEPLFKDDGLTPLFRIILKIDQKWRIPDDSRASIAAAGPLQVNVIEIIPGDSSVALGHGQKILTSDTKPGLFHQLAELTTYMQKLVKSTLSPLLISLKKQIHVMEKLIFSGGGPNSHSAQQIMENLKMISVDIRKLLSAIDPDNLAEVVSSTQGALENIDGLAQSLDAHSQKIEKVLSEYQKLGESLNETIKTNESNVDKALSEANFLIQDLSMALPPILDSVQEATRNLKELSRDLRDNPSVIIRGRKKVDNSPQVP